VKPFLQGRKTLPVEPLRLPPGFVQVRGKEGTAGKLCPAPDDTLSPKVEVVKEGDKVVRLAITCSCGERIEIDCLYPAGS
jgi:hypothetical protein